MDFFLLVSGALCPIREEGGRGEKKDSYFGVGHCYVYFCVGCGFSSESSPIVLVTVVNN